VDVVDGSVGVVEGAVGVVDGSVGVVEGAVGVVVGSVGGVEGAVGVVDGSVGVVEGSAPRPAINSARDSVPDLSVSKLVNTLAAWTTAAELVSKKRSGDT